MRTACDAELEEARTRPMAMAARLLAGVMRDHADPEHLTYNECDTARCFFCDLAAIVVERLGIIPGDRP